MGGELISVARRLRRLRVDAKAPEPTSGGARAAIAAVAVAAAFVLLGGAQLELGESEAKLGMAAGENLGPFGIVFGFWEPGLPFGQVVLSRLWTFIAGGPPTTAAVRWPATLAVFASALILIRRVRSAVGSRAALFTSLALGGTVAAIDRSAALGIDPLTSLAILGALDRILSRGSDFRAGLWAAAAVLCGGWPALAVVLLPILVLGRPGSSLSARLLLPPALAFGAWAAWAVAWAKPAALAAALALPLNQSPAWRLIPWLLVIGLPWTPLALLALWRPVREAPPAVRSLLLTWLQVAGVLAIAGTLIPGLATAARLPALGALAVASGVALDRAWTYALTIGARRTLIAWAATLAIVWALFVFPLGIYLAAAMPYYRIVLLTMVGLALTTGWIGFTAARHGDPRRAVIALVLIAAGLKLGHLELYAPEANYRLGQGPWGRAIGQHVPGRWPIFTFLPWRPELAFATGRPFRQLPDARLLIYAGPGPHFVLLQQAEFEHWPQDAPRLVKVRSLQDERGAVRVLARTAGPLNLRRAAVDAE